MFPSTDRDIHNLMESKEPILKFNRDEMEKDSDDTNRVFYVGATRAKKELHIIQPQQERGFII